MADQDSTEQLLALLIQLKKTTPQAARDILNSQPAIPYALIGLMVSIGAINIEVFQKVLSQFHESNPRGHPALQPTASTPPITAVPPHVQAQYRTNTPPPTVGTPPVYGGFPSQQAYQQPPTPSYPSAAASSTNYPAYSSQPQPQPSYPGYPPQNYTTSTPQPPPPAASTGGRPASAPAIKPEMLSAFPEDQKALIMHVISMSQEQLNSLPPEQRNTYMQIRATLGIS